ncbi:MAG: hypothetical protein ACREJ5_24710, partial [Geminicoccaceae bacterium]
PAADRDIFRSSGKNCSIPNDWSSFIRTTIAVGDLIHSDAALALLAFDIVEAILSGRTHQVLMLEELDRPLSVSSSDSANLYQ